MTYFQAYLLTTLLPNIGCTIGVFAGMCALSIIIMVIGYMMKLEESWDEVDKVKVRQGFKLLPIKKTISAFFCLMILGSILPSTQQVAQIIGLSVITSADAKKIYGDAGDYIKAFLKQQTEEMTNGDKK